GNTQPEFQGSLRPFLTDEVLPGRQFLRGMKIDRERDLKAQVFCPEFGRGRGRLQRRVTRVLGCGGYSTHRCGFLSRPSFGKVTRKTPLRKSARICSGSTDAGSRNRRTKCPERRSR